MLRCKLFNILPNLIFYTHLGTSAQVSERAYEPLDSGIHVIVLCRDNFSWSCSVILNNFFPLNCYPYMNIDTDLLQTNPVHVIFLQNLFVPCTTFIDVHIWIYQLIVWFIRISKILGDPWFYIELFLLNVYKTIIISYFNHLTLVE